MHALKTCMFALRLKVGHWVCGLQAIQQGVGPCTVSSHHALLTLTKELT